MDNDRMVLTVQEESLIHAVRALPANQAEKILLWARQLSDLADGRKIEWSDSWTDEDAAEATAFSVHNLEEQEKTQH